MPTINFITLVGVAGAVAVELEQGDWMSPLKSSDEPALVLLLALESADPVEARTARMLLRMQARHSPAQLLALLAAQRPVLELVLQQLAQVLVPQ